MFNLCHEFRWTWQLLCFFFKISVHCFCENLIGSSLFRHADIMSIQYFLINFSGFVPSLIGTARTTWIGRRVVVEGVLGWRRIGMLLANILIKNLFRFLLARRLFRWLLRFRKTLLTFSSMFRSFDPLVMNLPPNLLQFLLLLLDLLLLQQFNIIDGDIRLLLVRNVGRLLVQLELILVGKIMLPLLLTKSR